MVGWSVHLSSLHLGLKGALDIYLTGSVGKTCTRLNSVVNLLSCVRNIMSNKVFYQHPNLMRALGMHETVMEVMVNVLGGGDSKVHLDP